MMPDPVTLLQADVQELPFRPEYIDTVLPMGMLLLFEDAIGHVEPLLRVLVPDGTLFAASLVAEQATGRQYLRPLHRTGEGATPRTYADLRRLTSTLGGGVGMERGGSVASLTVQSSY